MAFEALLGPKLLGKSGEVSTSEALSGKKAVGVYFSAHWCPPCRGFTPKLAEWYKKDLQAKGMEIVFVSSDKDDSAFASYYEEMPWLSVPFDSKAIKAALDKKFKVQGIPSFVILDGEGNMVTTDGREAVTEDPEGNGMPWKPKTMAELLDGLKLRKGKETMDIKAAFAGKKAIGLYFSAHWCPPCRGFTPQLAEWYKNHLQAKGLEIIFVSSDKDEQSFEDYYAEQPWLALDFADRAAKTALSNKCKVSGIPSFVIIDPKDLSVITTEGRGAVTGDTEGNELPWFPKPIQDLASGPGSINDTPTVIVFCESAGADGQKALEDALTPIGQKYMDAAKASGDDPELGFLMAKAGGGLAGRIRGMLKLEVAPPGPHEHPMEDKGAEASGWNCDGCNQSGSGKKRFRCSQGCDYDYCGDCYAKSQNSAAAPPLPITAAIIDIPSSGAYYIAAEAPSTTAGFETFIADYKAGTLERQQLG